MKLERCIYKGSGYVSLASVSYKGRGAKVYISHEAASMFRDRHVKRCLVIWQDMGNIFVLKPLSESDIADLYSKGEEEIL